MMETKVAPLVNSRIPRLPPMTTDDACFEYRMYTQHEKALIEKWQKKEPQDAEVLKMKKDYKIDEWENEGK